MRIVSRNGFYAADLAEVDEGIALTVWRQARSDGPRQFWSLYHNETIDLPFHVVRDQVAAWIETLNLSH